MAELRIGATLSGGGEGGQADPGQLVLVVVEMQRAASPGSRRSGGRSSWSVAPWNLSVQTKLAPGAGREPALDQREQPRRVADDVGEQPIDLAERARDRARRRSRGGISTPGSAAISRRERRLVDADHARAQPLAAPRSSRRGCCRDRGSARPGAGAARAASAPPRASGRRGSAGLVGPRRSAPRRSGTGSCSAPPRTIRRARAASTSRAAGAARERRAACDDSAGRARR